MKGISFNDYNKRYEAYLYIENNNKVCLGSFSKRAKAIDRLKAAQKAVDGGQNLREWLASHPNKKNFSTSHEGLEDEYNKFLEEVGEPNTKDGYHFKLGFAFTNYRRFQKKYKDELQGKTHLVKTVPYLDSSPDLFRDRNTVHFRYWKAHLGEIGKQITYNNLHITEIKLKMALLKVFQRNIYLPKKLKPTSDNYCEEWRKIGEELDDLVQECIYGIPKRKPELKTKIIFNPELNLSIEERQRIVTEHTSMKRKNKTLEKLKKYFHEDMSKKELHRKSGISLPTIRNHWENLLKQVA